MFDPSYGARRWEPPLNMAPTQESAFEGEEESISLRKPSSSSPTHPPDEIAAGWPLRTYPLPQHLESYSSFPLEPPRVGFGRLYAWDQGARVTIGSPWGGPPLRGGGGGGPDDMRSNGTVLEEGEESELRNVLEEEDEEDEDEDEDRSSRGGGGAGGGLNSPPWRTPSVRSAHSANAHVRMHGRAGSDMSSELQKKSRMSREGFESGEHSFEHHVRFAPGSVDHQRWAPASVDHQRWVPSGNINLFPHGGARGGGAGGSSRRELMAGRVSVDLSNISRMGAGMAPVSNNGAMFGMPPRPKLQRLMTIGVEGQKRVAVIGTGMFGTALGNRLAEAGYSITFGSRSGKSKHGVREDCSVTTVVRAMFFGDVIILALPASEIQTLCTDYGHAMQGKVVVDISNPGPRKNLMSMGETVAKLLPQTAVVKAFNTCSAYQLASADLSGGPKVVEMCGTSTQAKTYVATMIYDIGFTPADLGGIKAAKRMEQMPLQFYSKWITALMVTGIMSIPIFAYIVWRDINIGQLGWEQLPVGGMAATYGWLSIYMLTATYLAGYIATVMPKPLPSWLISWLVIRKQMGLIAVALAFLHAISAVVVLSPNYERTFNIFNSMGKLNAIGQLLMAAGIIALALLSIISVTSLPSVVAALSWKEWDFVHKKIGWASVVFSLIHLLIFAPYKGDWTSYERWPGRMPPSSIFAALPAIIAVFLKGCLVATNLIKSFQPKQYVRIKQFNREETSNSGANAV